LYKGIHGQSKPGAAAPLAPWERVRERATSLAPWERVRERAASLANAKGPSRGGAFDDANRNGAD